MNIFIIEREKKDLIEALIECEDDNEVIELLSGIRQKGIMTAIIIGLLNKFSEEHQENVDLRTKILKLKRKEEKEIEIL